MINKHLTNIYCNVNNELILECDIEYYNIGFAISKIIDFNKDEFKRLNFIDKIHEKLIVNSYKFDYDMSFYLLLSNKYIFTLLYTIDGSGNAIKTVSFNNIIENSNLVNYYNNI